MHSQLKELYGKLSGELEEDERRDCLIDAVSLLAEELAGPLGLMADEVAIQAVVSDGSSLRFLYPQVLYESGATFPITSSSIAGLSVLRKKANFDNAVVDTKHLMFYEKLNTGVRKPMPIHKMASVPLVSNDTAVGVVQLSRRAETSEKAGPDFTSEDIEQVHEALTIAAALLADHVYGKM